MRVLVPLCVVTLLLGVVATSAGGCSDTDSMSCGSSCDGALPSFTDGMACSTCDSNTGPGYDAGSSYDDANMVDAGTDAADAAGKDAATKDAASKDASVKDGSMATDAHSDGPG